MNRLISSSVVIASTLAAAAALAQDNHQREQQSSRTSDESTVAQSDSKPNQGDRTASTQKRSTKDGSNMVLPVVTVLVPVEMENRTDSNLASGCWAKLFGGEQFKGDSLTLVGPVDMRQMTGPFGMEWGDKVSSLKVGPKATVTIYDNENFRDRAATVKPQQQVADLSERMGFFDQVRSIKIGCAGGAGSTGTSD